MILAAVELTDNGAAAGQGRGSCMRTGHGSSLSVWWPDKSQNIIHQLSRAAMSCLSCGEGSYVSAWVTCVVQVQRQQRAKHDQFGINKLERGLSISGGSLQRPSVVIKLPVEHAMCH